MRIEVFLFLIFLANYTLKVYIKFTGIVFPLFSIFPANQTLKVYIRVTGIGFSLFLNDRFVKKKSLSVLSHLGIIYRKKVKKCMYKYTSFNVEI